MARIKVNTEIELGWRVCDSITGLTGIATSYAQFLNGCERIAVTPEGLKDGKTLDTEYFDVEQVVVLDKKPRLHTPSVEHKPEKKTKRTGGPMPAPTRNPDPK